MTQAPKEMKYYVYYGNCVPAGDPGGSTTKTAIKKLQTAFNKQWPGMLTGAIDTLRRYKPNVEFTLVETHMARGIFFATTSETLPKVLAKHPLSRVDQIPSQYEYERALASMSRPKQAPLPPPPLKLKRGAPGRRLKL